MINQWIKNRNNINCWNLCHRPYIHRKWYYHQWLQGMDIPIVLWPWVVLYADWVEIWMGFRALY